MIKELLFLCACVGGGMRALDTWSLNKMLQMFVSVCALVPGSLQRSFMSLELENKHQQTHDNFLVSRFWHWSHDCDSYQSTLCVLWQLQTKVK